MPLMLGIFEFSPYPDAVVHNAAEVLGEVPVNVGRIVPSGSSGSTSIRLPLSPVFERRCKRCAAARQQSTRSQESISKEVSCVGSWQPPVVDHGPSRESA